MATTWRSKTDPVIVSTAPMPRVIRDHGIGNNTGDCDLSRSSSRFTGHVRCGKAVEQALEDDVDTKTWISQVQV